MKPHESIEPRHGPNRATTARRAAYTAVGLLAAAALLAGCGSGDDDLSENATAIFDECLRRNGVTAEDLQVTVSDDRAVRRITARIVAEGDAAYEPAIRLACTDEVELRLAEG